MQKLIKKIKLKTQPFHFQGIVRQVLKLYTNRYGVEYRVKNATIPRTGIAQNKNNRKPNFMEKGKRYLKNDFTAKKIFLFQI